MNFKQRRDKNHRALMKKRYDEKIKKIVDRILKAAVNLLSRPVYPNLVFDNIYSETPMGSTVDYLNETKKQ